MLQFDEVEPWPLWVNSFDVNMKFVDHHMLRHQKIEVFHHDAK